MLHATVFLAGSTEEIVDGSAADEAVQGMAGYLQRLEGEQLSRVREDLDCLIAFARQAEWPRELVRFLKSFLSDYGVEEGGEDDYHGQPAGSLQPANAFHGIGEAGQRRLLDSRVTLCGCGALGTVLANALVRAGVGHVRIIDRDFIET